MTAFDPTPCDSDRLNRFLDGELTPTESDRMQAHLSRCSPCRRHVSSMTAFSEGVRERIDQVASTVDFSALEKTVVTTALRRYRSRESGGFLKSLKIVVPAVAVAGMLVFFAYSRFLVQTPPVPSAIINSFTGSVSSVMIFETPETRQTILWYNEATDAEDDNNAV